MDKLQENSLSTLSNSINRFNIIQVDLYLKITRHQKIDWSDCLVIVEGLSESDYIYPNIYLQIIYFSNSAEIGYSKFEIVFIISYINILIFLNIFKYKTDLVLKLFKDIY